MPPKFDMQAARDAWNDIQAGRIFDGQVTAAACMLPAALDEIERLQKEISEKEILRDRHNAAINAQAKRIAELDSENAMHRTTIEAFKAQIIENAKRIAELEARAQKAEQNFSDYKEIAKDLDSDLFKKATLCDKQRAALKILGKRSGKRGKALVEERARFTSAMAAVPLNAKFPDHDIPKARRQLRQEGLI